MRCFLVVLMILWACNNDKNTHEIKNTPKEQLVQKKHVAKQLTQKEVVNKDIAIDFVKEMTFEEALQLAKKKKQPLFVDVYTPWCKPCKEMDKNVFTNIALAAYFNKHFINYKLNASTPDNRQIARSYGVSAYPTLIFVEPNGESLLSSIGYIDATMLMGYGQDVIKDWKP